MKAKSDKMMEANVGCEYTKQQLTELGLVDTHSSFGGARIYERGDERFLVDETQTGMLKISFKCYFDEKKAQGKTA